MRVGGSSSSALHVVLHARLPVIVDGKFFVALCTNASVDVEFRFDCVLHISQSGSAVRCL